MKARLRAAAFAVGALVCAGLSAAIAGTAGTPGAGASGALRQVVVTASPLERGTVLRPRALAEDLDIRRIPEAFVPADALGLREEALSRRLATHLPAGSYLTASSFRAPGAQGRSGAPKGTTPVEVTVTGAGALAASRTDPGDGVDVVVSGDSVPGPGAGRTYVAASGVRLLGLEEAPAEAGVESERWVATLALTRRQALGLIRAETSGAQVRLLAG